jgi:anthranilate synthase/aminodeoxychorismate synthase-like glutamine amidotransferase
MLLVVDNYDSFTWNLVHGLMRWASDVHVVQSAEVRVEQVLSLDPRGVVLSPGPGRPVDAGVSLALVRGALGRFPILGVCLGHQVLCEALGARIERAQAPQHGRASAVRHDGRGLFDGLPNPLRVARYHSLVVAEDSLPLELEAVAWSEGGELMAVRHRSLPAQSVQFHPESFLTEHGERMLEHFVRSLPPERDSGEVRRASGGGAAFSGWASECGKT